MPDSVAFFDTSAIVPLCVAQPSSQKAKQTYRSFSRQVIAWPALIEASGAIYRAVRLGGLSESSARRALGRLAQLEKRWTEIVASDRVRHSAISLLSTYDLRAADAVQLASALVWCKDKPRNRAFVCFDQKLATAARAVGFTAVGIV
ncbi:MAG: type II toxin-antitoxin system VapC family toxin [Acidobacteriota bacterium]